jgi:hypothetical protein
MILHTITLSNLLTGEQYTRSLSRPYRLTYIGAERILRRSGECQNSTVVRIETAIYSR